jgi:flagellar basal body-associated protein FliL
VADSAIAEKTSRHRYADAKWFVLLAVAVVSAAWVLRERPSSTPPPDTQGEAAVKSVLHLDPFVLNLVDPDERSYLRVGIDLGLDKERKDDNPPVALVRDAILGVLTRCRPSDVLTEEGKARLKQELLTVLQQRAPQLGVEDIYFTEFLVQR